MSNCGSIEYLYVASIWVDRIKADGWMEIAVVESQTIYCRY